MKNILIVVDMQNDFIDGALGTKEAVAIVGNVKEKIANFDGEVIRERLSRHTGRQKSSRRALYLRHFRLGNKKRAYGNKRGKRDRQADLRLKKARGASL